MKHPSDLQQHKEHSCCEHKESKVIKNNKASDEAIYICPMHLEIKQLGFGNCPVCGMALEPMEILSDQDTENPELIIFSKRFKYSILFTIPLLILTMSEMFTQNPFHTWFPGNIMNWVELFLAMPVLFWSGYPIFHRGWFSIKTRNLNMFTSQHLYLY